MTAKFLPLSLALGFALSSIASAAIVGGDVAGYNFLTSTPISGTTTASAGTTFSLNQFDPALGTLTGVRIDMQLTGWTGTYSFVAGPDGEIRAVSTGGADPKIVFATNPISGFPGSGSKLTANVSQTILAATTSYVSDTFSIVSVTPAASGSANYENTATALSWATTAGMVGSGTFNLKYSSVANSNFNVADGTLTGGLTGDLKTFVTYTYTPPGTPEPASVLLGGMPALLGAAHLLRRRRR